MKKTLTFVAALVLALTTFAQTKSMVIMVKENAYQTITGFGAADCDGAMKPFGTDIIPVRLLYGPNSAVQLNIMRMEISPNFDGDVWGDYDWEGGVPSAKIVKQYGGIVFGTPWSPPGAYKTNGSAQGGNTEKEDAVRGKLREDCYEKFFPWLNTFLAYMKSRGVKMDAVSIQNEPDWWVNYSGCLYEPAEQVKLVKNYAHLLDREKYNNVKLMSAEPLGYRNDYYTALYNDATCREQINIIAGHIYGHAPLDYIKPVSNRAHELGMEVWQTENSVSDGIQGRLPNWDEQLDFARTVHECLLAGCNAYVYWYMRAHWAFVGTGETQYGTDNKKNKLLPRAYVYSHFSRNVTGGTRIGCSANGVSNFKTNDAFESSAYAKGDSIIVMAVNRNSNPYKTTIKLPKAVKSGTLYLSTGNQTDELYQQSEMTIESATNLVSTTIPAKSICTFVFMKDNGETVISDTQADADNAPAAYYDFQGRRLSSKPRGMYIERYADGTSRKVNNK